MRNRRRSPSDRSRAPDIHRTTTTSMNTPLSPWLLSHLGSGVLLGVVLLTVLLIWRRASAAQRSSVIGIFLAAMAIAAPLQLTRWPEIAIPVKRENKTLPMPPPLSVDVRESPVMTGTPDVAPSAGVLPPSASASMSGTGTLLGVIWAVGVGVLLARLAAGWWQWRRLWKGARISDHPMAQHVEAEVRVSEVVRVPMSSGRQILMPKDWLCWPRGDQAAALEHELAHGRHQDGLRRWLAAVTVALHWPSPLVWFAERRLRLAQEQRCDEAVITSGADVVSYGQLLMRCAKQTGPQHPWLPTTVATMACPAQLALRIEHLAGGPRALRPARWWHVLWALLLVAACLQALHLRLEAQTEPQGANQGSPTRVGTAPDEAQERASIELRKAPARALNIDEPSWQMALAKLASDAGIQMALSDADGTKGGAVKLQMTASPFAALEQICAERQLSLIYREGIWLIHPSSAVPPVLGPPVILTKDSSLRTELPRRYEFSQAILGDVIRFVATDARISFIGLADGAPEAKRPVTCSLNASPFTVLETLCRLHQIDLTEENGIWIVRTRTPEEKHMASASAGLRAMPPKQYDFSRAVLGDVLLYLAKDAGMTMSVPENDPRMKSFITFSIKAAPYSVMETLCRSNGARLELKEGLWQVR